MRHSYSAVLLLCLPIVYASAFAKDQGHGRVSVRGRIIETPCSIDMQSRDQSIDLGVTPTGVIARDGHSEGQPFNIRLVNCQLERLKPGLPDWRYFQITFSGNNRDELFVLDGIEHGVGLQVTDAEGNIAHPDKPLPIGELSPGSMQLNYNLRLVGNHHSLRTGDFHSSVRFRMDYY